MTKISELSTATPALTDIVPIIDVSDPTDSAAGTNKRVTLTQIQDLVSGEVTLPLLGTPLLVNGKPFQMRGINYSSNYSGGSSTNPWYVETGQLALDFADIVAAGFNTIKVYADENNASDHLAALDLAEAAGLKVILLRFITYSTDYSVATGQTNRTAALAKYTGMVTNLAAHSAVIGVGFGNEQNYNLGVTPESDWYTLVEAAMQAGRTILDSDTDSEDVFQFTAAGDIATITDYGLTYAPSVEVWGSNIYESAKIELLPKLSNALIAAEKPFILTEFGRARTADTQVAQDVQGSEDVGLIQQLEQMYPYVNGYVFFKFTDSVAPGTVFGITSPLAQSAATHRTQLAAYTMIKQYLTGYGYGSGAYIMRTGDTMLGTFRIKSSNSSAFAVGQNGVTNPAFRVATDGASSATGIKVVSAAAGSGVNIEAISSGTNEGLTIRSKGSGSIIFSPGSNGVDAVLFKNAAQNATIMRVDTTNSRVGILKTSPGATLDVGGAIRADAASVNAFLVGPNGATNVTLRVDTATASAATGIVITAAAAAAGIAIAATSSATDENMTIDAKGTGTITLQGTATGHVVLGSGLDFAEGKNITLGATTGTKIGTATTEKLGFWNKTPVVQPTTGISAAAFAANTSGITNDTATYGGYTAGQVVAALKLVGLLA